MEGSLPYFGRLSFAGAFPPTGSKIPATGRHVSPNRSWTGMRFASDDYGDLKFILEPSRFLFVYPLARAYAISDKEQFAELFASGGRLGAQQSSDVRSVVDLVARNPPCGFWPCRLVSMRFYTRPRPRRDEWSCCCR